MARGFYDLNIMRDSANSVIANIAEAHGRYYFADKARLSKGISSYIRSLKKTNHLINQLTNSLIN